MTAAQAQALGYKVVVASAYEVGLIKHGKGVRTWFCQDFDRTLPSLEHPLIQKAINDYEEFTASVYDY